MWSIVSVLFAFDPPTVRFVLALWRVLHDTCHGPPKWDLFIQGFSLSKFKYEGFLRLRGFYDMWIFYFTGKFNPILHTLVIEKIEVLIMKKKKINPFFSTPY